MISKSDEEQVLELETALVYMPSLVKHFHEARQNHYLLGVITQLRALVAFDPTGKSKKLQPLLMGALLEAFLEWDGQRRPRVKPRKLASGRPRVTVRPNYVGPP